MPVDVFAQALRALDAGRGVALASVTGASGSTPRHLGARMAVADDGEQWGTIGGGRIEQLVVQAAKEVAGGAAARVVKQHLVRDLAMCCGGTMEVAITPAAPSRDVIAAVAGTKKSQVLVTPLDGGPLSLRAGAAARGPLVEGDALVEKIGAAERVILFGLGHVARNVGPLLDHLGFAVYACDDGETGATGARPAWAADVIESFDAKVVEDRLGGLGEDDYVLIVTRDHAIDQQLLEQLIAHPALGYLGMIGSRGKVARFQKRLEAKGLYDETTWRRLRAPIGLDLGAETPEEIAISIAAELVAKRRRGIAAAGEWRRT